MIISKYIYIFPSQCLLTQKSYESRNHLCSLSAVSELSCAVLFFCFVMCPFERPLTMLLVFLLFFEFNSPVFQFLEFGFTIFKKFFFGILYEIMCWLFICYWYWLLFLKKTCIYLKNIKHIYNDKWNANTQWFSFCFSALWPMHWN